MGPDDLTAAAAGYPGAQSPGSAGAESVCIRPGQPLRYTDPSGHAGGGLVSAAWAVVELAPEAYAAAAGAVSALTVAVGQHQQEASAAAHDVTDHVQAIGLQSVGSVFTAYSSASRTLDRALGGTVGDRKDAHHLIPLDFKNNPVVRRARALGWKINGAGNGILLPDNLSNAEKEKKPAHLDSHPKWTAHVEDQLTEIEKRAIAERWTDNDVRWRKAVEDLDKKLLDDINDQNQNPPGQALR